MIDEYKISITDAASFEAEKADAYARFRNEMQRWRKINPECHVVLDGESSSGEWSIVFEHGFWLAFVGERGTRQQMCAFTNVWDAVSYAGYRAVLAGTGDNSFPLLRPYVSLA